MTQLNIDKVIQNKLQGLNCDYHPEFWNDMEKKINASPLSGGSSSASIFSSTTIISAITVFIVSIGAISYFIINNGEEQTDQQISKIAQIENTIAHNNTSDNIDSENITTVIATETTTIDKPINNTNKITSSNSSDNRVVSTIINNDADDNKSIIPPSTTAEDKLLIMDIINSNSNTASTKSEHNCTEINIQDYEVDLLNDSEITTDVEADFIEMHNTAPKENINHKRDIASEKAKEDRVGQENKDNSELKKVKPMPRPAKKVFGKKRGILYRLGLRK